MYTCRILASLPGIKIYESRLFRRYIMYLINVFIIWISLVFHYSCYKGFSTLLSEIVWFERCFHSNIKSYFSSFLKAVIRNVNRKCKCHGMSGSCEMQTCWKATPDFKEVGNRLKRKYRAARKVKVNVFCCKSFISKDNPPHYLL